MEIEEKTGMGEGIRDSADIRATDIRIAKISLNAAELLNNTFMYFSTFIYRIVSLPAITNIQRRKIF